MFLSIFTPSGSHHWLRKPLEPEGHALYRRSNFLSETQREDCLVGRAEEHAVVPVKTCFIKAVDVFFLAAGGFHHRLLWERHRGTRHTRRHRHRPKRQPAHLQGVPLHRRGSGGIAHRSVTYSRILLVLLGSHVSFRSAGLRKRISSESSFSLSL